jgi:uncharacterized protein YbaR (Trm112 family)
MFIELTDHLRCPEDHDEAYLVLLPDVMEGRSVRTGRLGCPVCGRTYEVKDGVVDFGGPPAAASGSVTLDPPAVTALVGLGGPGGYLLLVGDPAAGWREIARLNPGVALVAVNPPRGLRDEPGVSLVRAGRLPLKSRSMRGVVLGPPFGQEEAWVRDAARVVLPGLRVVGEGPVPPASVIDLLASAGGVWVGVPRR